MFHDPDDEEEWANGFENDAPLPPDAAADIAAHDAYDAAAAPPEPEPTHVEDIEPPPVQAPPPMAAPPPVQGAPAQAPPDPVLERAPEPRRYAQGTPNGPSSPVPHDDPGAYAFEQPDPDPPKKVSLLDDEGAQWAALLDVALNRGRGVGKILGAAATEKQKKQQRGLDDDLKLAQIEHLRSAHQGKSAAELALQQQRLGLQAQSMGLQRDREGRLNTAAGVRVGEQKRKQDPGSDTARSVQGYLYARHPDMFPPGSLDKLGIEGLQQLRSPIASSVSVALGPQKTAEKVRGAGLKKTKEIEVEHENAGTIAADAATKKDALDQVELKNASSIAQARAEGAEIGRGDLRERRFYKDSRKEFIDANDRNLDIAGLAEDIDSEPGGVIPKSLRERLANDSTIAARGLDPSRMNVVAAKRYILELWGRELTGAAKSRDEDSSFRREVAAMVPTASDTEVESTYETLKRTVQRRIAGSAKNNPASIDVLKGYVSYPEEYINVTPEEARRWQRPAHQAPGTTPTPQPVTQQLSNPAQPSAAPTAIPAEAAAPDVPGPTRAELQALANEGLQTTGSGRARQGVDANGRAMHQAVPDARIPEERSHWKDATDNAPRHPPLDPDRSHAKGKAREDTDAWELGYQESYDRKHPPKKLSKGSHVAGADDEEALRLLNGGR